MKRILIVTDTWEPNQNGVVTAIRELVMQLRKKGVEVLLLHPGDFFSFPLPSYPEMKLAFVSQRRIGRTIEEFRPDSVHIVTQGTLGLAVLRYCSRKGLASTTAYHTELPDYVDMRIPGTKRIVWKYLRWFHAKSSATLVSTPSLKQELAAAGISNVHVSPLGVDVGFFSPSNVRKRDDFYDRPVFVYVGRVAIEKNIRAFLECDLPGTKLVIGDGPARKELEAEFSSRAIFVGKKEREEVRDLLQECDCMVFPSRTDTLGLVMLEALSCGLPVAAYDVRGPRDIITNGLNGYLGEDLAGQALHCLKLDPKACRETALAFSWEKSADAFLKNQVPL